MLLRGRKNVRDAPDAGKSRSLGAAPGPSGSGFAELRVASGRLGRLRRLPFRRRFRGKRREFLDSAVDFYRQAVDRSPTDAAKRAKLVAALRDVATLAAVENADFPFPTVDAETALADARREAEIALELDAQTPHLDRKLPDETRVELRRFLENAR
ncbi:MAG: hypothetical protein IIY07_05970 [Thermoguttaceae bacterium]|nr:hypothetical protein [Thermoguttaceae bacterium]